MPLAWYGLYRVEYQENVILKNAYLEIHIPTCMGGIEQLIDWHYSVPGSEEKTSLLNELRRAWEPLSDDKLHKNLDNLLTREKTLNASFISPCETESYCKKRIFQQD